MKDIILVLLKQSKERYLAQEQQSNVFGARGKAVIRTFAGHVGEIDSLSKLKKRKENLALEEYRMKGKRMRKEGEVFTMYPVTGASGGAIRNPWFSIPTQFVSLEPCHRSILKHTAIVKGFGGA